ncbi:putative membrane protein YdjX (TVP38/TMEM64 family) [Rhodobium orientis]|uniref:TVP38/TMEM64 family protein n=1 Tax=Rhodobium orientis TaxID=34017 RepID=UPI0017A0D934|nr:TVP38/TMEM64 family protein [Rhodobium orientis]MBB4304685.1 putative membrane protein YdjX (TVP38/TMEM64 family) [Rhodobium orientis]
MVRHAKRWVPLVAILALMVAGYLAGWHDYLSLSELIRHRGTVAGFIADNRVTSILIYAAVYALVIALSFPGGSFLTIAGGLFFGWLVGGLVTVVAATLGATAIFLAARTSLGDALRARAGPRLSQLSEGFRKDAASYLLFLRLTPIFPFWLVNLAPALFHVPLGTYVLTTVVGIIPGTFAYAVFGSGLDSVIAAQEQANPGCGASGTCSIDTSAILTPELIAAFVLLGVVALIPAALKKWRRARAAGNGANKS